MLYFALAIVLLVVLFVVLRMAAPRRGAPGGSLPPPSPAGPARAPDAAPPAPAPAPAASPSLVDRSTARPADRPLPAALQSLRITRFTELPPPQARQLAARLSSIPRPPHALDQLVSAQFLAQATSAELNALMVGEPQIAARVLAAVNSPLYGLQKPLGNIGQAATYLGMNTVRSICLQYMLDASVKPTSPDIQACYGQAWNASALSSALCFKLAQLLKLPDPGSLVTQIVLSSLGTLASYALLEPPAVLQFARTDALARAQAQQQALGLWAGELAGLLLQSWDLPAALIEDVCDIDRVMHVPAAGAADARMARLGLCYLCKCIGEQVASGTRTDLRQFEVDAMEDPAIFHLAGYLHNFRLERLPEFLQFPEVLALVDQMAEGFRIARPQRPV